MESTTRAIVGTVREAVQRLSTAKLRRELKQKFFWRREVKGQMWAELLRRRRR